MTTTLVTLIGDVTDAIGTDFDARRTKAYVRYNTPKVVTDGDEPIHLGGGTVNVESDGTFELPNVVASTSLVENLQATVYVDYADPTTRQRATATFGPYDLSAETGTVAIRDLEAVQALPATAISQATAALEAMVAEGQALLDQQELVAGLTGEDDAVALLINTPSSDTANSLAASFVQIGTTFSTPPLTFGTDARAPIQAAVDAAVAYQAANGDCPVTVVIRGRGGADMLTGSVLTPPAVTADPSPNTYNLQGVQLPVNLPARLTISYEEGSTQRLSALCKNAFVIKKIADYDVFRHVHFQLNGLTLDVNNVQNQGHDFIGNVPGYTTSQRFMSFDDIDLDGGPSWATMVNVPTDVTGADAHRGWVYFYGRHNTYSEATQTSSTKIHARRLRQYGGDFSLLVSVPNEYGGIGTPGPTNHYHDDIVFEDVEHYLPDPPVDYIAQTSFHIAGGGFGDYCRITRSLSDNSGDDGIEIGAMQHVVIESPRTRNTNIAAILLRFNQAPPDPATHLVEIRNWIHTIDGDYFAAAGAGEIRSQPLRSQVDNSHTVTLTGAPTGGTFRLAGNSTTTATIAYNASAATVQAEIRALGGPFAEAVVSGTGPWRVTLGQASPLTLNTNSLTGGTAPSVTIASTYIVLGTLKNTDPALIVNDGVFSKLYRPSFDLGWHAGGPWARQEDVRPAVRYSNFDYDSAASGTWSWFDSILIGRVVTAGATLEYADAVHIIRDASVTLDGVTSTGAGSFRTTAFSVGGTAHTIDLDGFDWQAKNFTTPAGTAGVQQFLLISASTICKKIRLRNVRPLFAGVPGYGSYMYRANAGAQVGLLDIDDCDHRGLNNVGAIERDLIPALSASVIRYGSGIKWIEAAGHIEVANANYAMTRLTKDVRYTSFATSNKTATLPEGATVIAGESYSVKDLSGLATAGATFGGSIVINVSGWSRTATSVTTTNGSPTVSGAAGKFLAADVNRLVTGTGIPANTRIGTVASDGSSATLIDSAGAAVNATASGTVTLTLQDCYWDLQTSRSISTGYSARVVQWNATKGYWVLAPT